MTIFQYQQQHKMSRLTCVSKQHDLTCAAAIIKIFHNSRSLAFSHYNNHQMKYYIPVKISFRFVMEQIYPA